MKTILFSRLQPYLRTHIGIDVDGISHLMLNELFQGGGVGDKVGGLGENSIEVGIDDEVEGAVVDQLFIGEEGVEVSKDILLDIVPLEMLLGDAVPQ